MGKCVGDEWALREWWECGDRNRNSRIQIGYSWNHTNREIISINANTNRIIQGNYGIFDRNDEVTYYKLITASWDQYGTWNSLRPLSINITSGDVGIGNSAIYVQHGANVGIGTINPGYKLDVNGDARIDGLYIWRWSGSVSSNTAVWYQALQTNSTGSSNSAFGYRALYSNTTGYYNTAIGRSALYSNTEGIYNTFPSHMIFFTIFKYNWRYQFSRRLLCAL